MPHNFLAAKHHQTENNTWIHVAVNAWISWVLGLESSCETPVTWGRWGLLLAQAEQAQKHWQISLGQFSSAPGSLPCLPAAPVLSSTWLRCWASYHGSLSLMGGQRSPRAGSARQAAGKQQPDQLLSFNPCRVSQQPLLPAALHQMLLGLSRAAEDLSPTFHHVCVS